MIYFEISAPYILYLFESHQKGILAPIDLRTTLLFTELQENDKIELCFPDIYLIADVAVKEFLEFHYTCVENMDIMLLHKKVLDLIKNARIDHSYAHEVFNKKYIQVFYFLLIYISYKENIKIKSFKISVSPKLKKEFVCPTSFTICLAACFLQWSRVQKGIRNNFNCFDLERIESYAALCQKIFPAECMKTNVTACTYGSMIKYLKKETENIKVFYSMFALPNVSILLVDTKQMYNSKAWNEGIKKFEKFEVVKSILNNLENVMDDIFEAVYNLTVTFENNKITLETRNNRFLEQHKELEILIRENQRLLRLLDLKLLLNYNNVDKICSIVEKHGLSGRRIIIDDRFYFYIWYPENQYAPPNITCKLLSNELKEHGFDVTETNLASSGVKVRKLMS